MKEFILENKTALIIGAITVAILSLFTYTIATPNAGGSQAPKSNEVEIVLGDEEASNTLVAYLDPLCDRCHQFKKEVISELNKQEVEDGTLSVSIRPLSITSRHSKPINEITLCADSQGKYLESSILIGNKIHGDDSDKTLDEKAKAFIDSDPTKLLAKELDLDQEKLKDCMSNSKNSTRLTLQDDLASQSNIVSTPTIFINDGDAINGYAQIGYIRGLIRN